MWSIFDSRTNQRVTVALYKSPKSAGAALNRIYERLSMGERLDLAESAGWFYIAKVDYTE